MAFTYSLLASSTVGVGGASSITFNNIPQNYTDLIVKISARNSAGSNSWDDIYVDINGSSSNFTSKVLYGLGSGSAGSNSFSSSIAQMGEGNNGTASTFSNTEMYFPNYSGSYNKSWSADSVSENNATAAIAQLGAGLWSNVTPISSLSFRWYTSGNFVQHSTAYLYGIRAGEY